MTDKQIACAYLERKLRWLIPDHDSLREIAETNLSEDRCYRIVKRILDAVDDLRRPLIEYLNKSGLDVA